MKRLFILTVLCLPFIQGVAQIHIWTKATTFKNVSLPSLFLTTIDPGTPKPGSDITVGFVLKNDDKGTSSARGGKIHVENRDQNDVVLNKSASMEVNGLEKGAEFSSNLLVKVPRAAGKYTVVVIYEEPEYGIDWLTHQWVLKGYREVNMDSRNYFAKFHWPY